MSELTKILELDKIILSVKEYAALSITKQSDNFDLPKDFESAVLSLDITEEADKLLYQYNIGGVEGFEFDEDVYLRAEKGFSLSLKELMNCVNILRSSRVLKNSINSNTMPDIVLLKNISSLIFADLQLEKELNSKIISEDELSDNASEKLATLRKQIKTATARIREKLNLILSKHSEFIQDSIITIRNNRFVIPFKAECKKNVKGFIHDYSSSKATVYIEPESVFHLNNHLKDLQISESVEIEKIILQLSNKIGVVSQNIISNAKTVSYIDSYFARAQYSYKNRCVKPSLNNDGIIDIKKARHPIISQEKVVPIDLELGKNYNLLLISGANTGGKTVALKLCGLFTLMAMCGIFLPCSYANVSFFNKIFCEIGDSQSIENELSTFSSHILSLKKITQNADEKSLVLIDELGDGTDPDEGQALALAVMNFLLQKKCKGIITTHFQQLKEYAFTDDRVMNACMEFDIERLMPLYKLTLGLPGSSNALSISKRLGLDENIILLAKTYLTKEKVALDKILDLAQSRKLDAERRLSEIEKIKVENDILQKDLLKEKALVLKEKEHIKNLTRLEIKKNIESKVLKAQEFLLEIEKISQQEVVTTSHVITARTLKNKLESQKYNDESENSTQDYKKGQPININNVKIGDTVYVSTIDKIGTIKSINIKKKFIVVESNSIKYESHIKHIFNVKNNEKVSFKTNLIVPKNSQNTLPIQAEFICEINLIGKTVLDAENECEKFIEQAVRASLSEIKIIHGKGTGKLRQGVRACLKQHYAVESFRNGAFGEGEDGVTIVTLK